MNTMEYSNWQLRRTIMSQPTLSISQRFYALVIIDNIDWSTGTKTFASRNHLANWLTRLAEVNGLNEEDIALTLDAMKKLGIVEMDGFTFVLRNDYHA